MFVPPRLRRAARPPRPRKPARADAPSSPDGPPPGPASDPTPEPEPDSPRSRNELRVQRPAPPELLVRCEENLHLDYCPRRRRHLWEAATFALRAIRVEGPDGVRYYGPLDRWVEPAPDPRASYTAVGTALIRRAMPGRDYDEARRVTGM